MKGSQTVSTELVPGGRPAPRITNQAVECGGTLSTRAKTKITFRRILVPADFSKTSAAVISSAIGWARHFQGKIHLMHVVEPSLIPEWGYAHLVMRDMKLLPKARNRLRQFISESRVEPGFVASASVKSGDADSQICLAAAQRKMNLIVIGRSGHGAISRGLLGSTAERVVRHSPCPVLVVRNQAADNEKRSSWIVPKRIMVTTDFSKASTTAFSISTELAREFGASLTLLHVVPSHLPGEIGMLGLVLEEKRLIQEARKRLPELAASAFPADLHVQPCVANGGPAHEIARIASATGADLIVIASCGRAGVKRFLLGSVAERVVRNAPCDVLAVRPLQERQKSSPNPRSGKNC